MKKTPALDLREVNASDLMQPDVLTLRTSAPVRDAIETFEEYHISGAPVADESGRLVGVLSAHDITRSEHVHEGRIETERREYYLTSPLDDSLDPEWNDADFARKDDYTSEGEARVADWMNPHIISVAPDASLAMICKTMATESIHRLLVVEEGTVKGIISTFDIVRFLAGNL